MRSEDEAEGGGHFDAADVLSEKYIYLCNDFREAPFEGMLETALVAHYLTQAAPGERLLNFMTDDFSQGFLVGSILAQMRSDYEAAMAEEGDEDVTEA